MTTPNNPYGDSASNGGFGANGAGDGAANGATPSNGSTSPGAGAGQGLPNYGSSDANPTGTSYPAGGTGSTAYGAGSGAGADYGTGAGAGSGYTGYGATGTPGYGQGYQGAGDWGAAAAQKSKLAPWALGVGIIALLSCLFVIPPVVLGPIGIILGIVALVTARKLPKEARRTWMSVTGLVLSVLSLLFIVVLAVIGVGIFNSANLEECMNITDPVEQQKCVEDNINSSFGQ